jgi:hypothetical protein
MSSKADQQPVPQPVSTSAYVSAILALVLVAEIAGIGAYAYYRVRRVLAPENLADRVEEAIRENYPEVRQEVVTEIKSQAPQIAEQVSQEILSSAPEARHYLERLTARELEAGLDQATQLSAEQFRKILDENRDKVEAAFEAIDGAPEEARQLILETEDSIETQLGVNIQQQAENTLLTYRRLNDKLERLVDPDATLEPQELLERRILRILKTMEEREFDHARFAKQPEHAPNRR